MIERKETKFIALEEPLDSEMPGSGTKVTIITPDIESDKMKSSSIEAVIILLHGMIQAKDNNKIYDNLPKELGLQEISDKYHVMIVIPFMKNCYYISSPGYDCARFISKELPAYILNEYPFTRNSEIIMGGISMGGYGAMLIGARTNAFDKVFSVSGAFITDDIIIGNPEVWGKSNPMQINKEESFLYSFQPFENLEESVDRNAFQAISHSWKKGRKFSFIMTCGSADWLYIRNKRFIKQLEMAGIPLPESFFYTIEGGKHEADCFKDGLLYCIDEFLKQ